MEIHWWILGGAVFALVALLLLWAPVRASWRKVVVQKAVELFRLRREHLEAEFFHRASQSGKPRGLRWTDCDFANEVTFARNRAYGSLTAFVGVTISFEAIEGGEMEEVEAVGNLRAGTAQFHFFEEAWRTNGKVMFNLDPAEAVAWFEEQLEIVPANEH